MMGLFKQAHDHDSSISEGSDSNFQPILSIPEQQPYADGVVFKVNDFKGLCRVLMNAYMRLNENPHEIGSQMDEIANYLDRNMSHLSMGGSINIGGMPASTCNAWRCLKNSMQDANIGPLDVVLKNSGRIDGNKPIKRRDWYAQREWFMSNLIVEQKQPLSDDASVFEDEDASKSFCCLSYKNWGVPGDNDTCSDSSSSNSSVSSSSRGGGGGVSRSLLSTFDTKSNLYAHAKMAQHGHAADAGVMSPANAPPFNSKQGRGELICIAELDTVMEEDGASPTARRGQCIASMLSNYVEYAKARCIKYRASPFSRVVVDVVKAAIRQVDSLRISSMQ